MNKLPEWANWLARDKNGHLYAYAEKPDKGISDWPIAATCVDERFERVKNHYPYNYVQWSDDKPYPIVRLREAPSLPSIPKTARHAEIAKQLNGIYEAKNHDYGDAFGQTFRELGIISAVTRITDKTNRLKKLCRSKNQVKDESIKDTLMDLANYAIMTLIELEDAE